MNEQKKECGCASNALLLKLLEQNNQLLKNQNKLTEQNNLILSQNTQVIQINNEQNAQINELLIQLEGDEDDEPKKSQYLDG